VSRTVRESHKTSYQGGMTAIGPHFFKCIRRKAINGSKEFSRRDARHPLKEAFSGLLFLFDCICNCLFYCSICQENYCRPLYKTIEISGDYITHLLFFAAYGTCLRLFPEWRVHLEQPIFCAIGPLCSIHFTLECRKVNKPARKRFLPASKDAEADRSKPDAQVPPQSIM
jgi:hypothetical protein